MKVLIYSDVHGNLPAFESVLKNEKDCKLFICLGDLVNYGPWSNECVDLARSLPNTIILLGNHEDAFINGSYPGSNQLVNCFFKECYKDFSRFSVIRQFKADYRLDAFVCKHTIMDQYVYPDTRVLLTNNYIIGHSHHQFEYNNGGFTLYNAGSIGQNRKYINVASYLIYDTETKAIQMKNMVYDINILINEMKARNYPEICLNYYLQKERA